MASDPPLATLPLRVTEPAWFPQLETGGLPPEPPAPHGEGGDWRPDDWLLLVATGLLIAALVVDGATILLQLRGYIDSRYAE